MKRPAKKRPQDPELAVAVQRCRESLEESQPVFGARVDVSGDIVQNWELGKSRVPLVVHGFVARKGFTPYPAGLNTQAGENSIGEVRMQLRRYDEVHGRLVRAFEEAVAQWQKVLEQLHN